MRGQEAVSPALLHGVADGDGAVACRQAARRASQPGSGAASLREHGDIGVAARGQHFVQVRDFADAALTARVVGAAARVRASQCWMMA